MNRCVPAPGQEAQRKFLPVPRIPLERSPTGGVAMEFIMLCVLHGEANKSSEVIRVEHFVQMCDENYETAASLRDQIKRIETDLSDPA